MRHPLLALILASTAFAQEPAAAPEAGPKPKLTVMPFAALSPEVPQRAGAKALGMLSQEFKSAESYQLIETPRANAAEAFTESLAAARKLVEDAKDFRAKRKFRLAHEALEKAIKAYGANAAGLTDINEVIDAYALLSAVQFNTGRDEEGQKNLSHALALNPSRELPLAATSALFGRVVADTRKALKAGPKGSLNMESTPSNAPLMLNGVIVGATPARITEVPPGVHFWRVQLPNGELVGGVVEAVANKQMKVTASGGDKDPEGKLLAALAQNKVDAEALKGAKEAAKAAGVDYVLFGALSREGKGLTLSSFLLAAASGELRRLPVASFDTEMLSAGMEFFNLAGEVAKKGAQVGEAVTVPAAVSITQVSGGPKIAEVKYGAATEKDDLEPAADTGAPAPKDGPKKPLGPRAPLKKK